VVSATDGHNLLLREYVLDHNHLRAVRSHVIGLTTGVEGVVGHALIARNLDGALFFDAYYGVCSDLDDIDCIHPTLSMKRAGSDLDLRGGRDFTITLGFSLATETLRTTSALSPRLFVYDHGGIEERQLDADGVPGPALFRMTSSYSSPSEDGKMMAAAFYDEDEYAIGVQKFHPRGPVSLIHLADPPVSLSLSGQLEMRSPAAHSHARNYRLLFFRVFRPLPSGLQNRVMEQKIDSTTAEFIGAPVAVTEFGEEESVYFFGQSVAVAPTANVVFYTAWDASCRKRLLWGQLFDPRAGVKVGTPQLLIRCDELPANYYSGIGDIDVVEVSR